MLVELLEEKTGFTNLRVKSICPGVNPALYMRSGVLKCNLVIL